MKSTFFLFITICITWLGYPAEFLFNLPLETIQFMAEIYPTETQEIENLKNEADQLMQTQNPILIQGLQVLTTTISTLIYLFYQINKFLEKRKEDKQKEISNSVQP